MKKWIKEYFSFSAKETAAALTLLLLIGGFIIYPSINQIKTTTSLPNDSLLQKQLMSSADTSNLSYSATTGLITNDTAEVTRVNNTYTLFSFNPNTLNEQGWLKLGLRSRTVQTILNYRNKGGKFKQPEDIRKIWGLKKEEADRIIPYAVIINDSTNNELLHTSAKQHNIPLKTIDINTAGIKDWQQLPFSDKTMPYRIIKYRDKLGGFIAIEQLLEAYGMSDSVFNQVKPYLQLEPATVHKININKASDYEISLHPYIPKNIAKAIVIYREQHGAYTKLEDIRKIVFIKEDLFYKIAPYLTVD